MVWKCKNQGEKEVMETKGQKTNRCISISMEGDNSGKMNYLETNLINLIKCLFS